ncbi:hypothetical protein K491DRAFT_208701 [Lophiostoma macrostomum CBS 122681]|uniref:Uncharacterized protein n=1 Tax=Lophiostoma macrostomum CBS 122681 TaxID=1314788 RepID=A0A6A6SNM9_9PLEO|nr:hypothetical protein K491DRAFT_208701 [Lophiostoma macrostomum CBS 122681]
MLMRRPNGCSMPPQLPCDSDSIRFEITQTSRASFRCQQRLSIDKRYLLYLTERSLALLDLFSRSYLAGALISPASDFSLLRCRRCAEPGFRRHLFRNMSLLGLWVNTHLSPRTCNLSAEYVYPLARPLPGSRLCSCGIPQSSCCLPAGGAPLWMGNATCNEG